MTDPVWLGIGKALLSPLIKLADVVYESFRRPAIRSRRAPENLFEHLRPGTSVSRVREVLGSPHREHDGQYCYRFVDACVQIDSKDKVTVDAISVGVARPGWRNHFPLWPMRDLVVGKTAFREIVEDEEVKFDYSSKFYHFYVVKYYGWPGLYCTYALGFLECPGVLPSVAAHWSPDQQSKEQIPPDLKINWACVSRGEDIPTFNYYGFV